MQGDGEGGRRSYVEAATSQEAFSHRSTLNEKRYRQNRENPENRERKSAVYAFFEVARSLLGGVGEPSSRYERKRLVIAGSSRRWKTAVFKAPLQMILVG